MNRIVFLQSKGWDKFIRDGGDPYSDERCCYCGKKVKGDLIFVCLSRDNQGEWYLCDPSEPQQEDEKE